MNTDPSYLSDSNVSFLGSVAQACVSRYDDLSDICFIFPNKRSSTFFLKILSESLGKATMLAPEVLDIESFVSRVSGLTAASRLDMLFRLYKVYCGLMGRSDSIDTEEDVLSFDHFAPWGDTLLGDFSEVDKYEVDAEALFRNVRDYRSIASNFLTEEQLDVIERYFGYRPSAGDVESFWKSLGDVDDRSAIKEKFIELWKLLPELYDGLRSNLDADSLGMPGTLFRLAAARVAREGRGVLPWSKVMVVGFNMISTSEASLFSSMRRLRDDDDEPFADFFWDATGPVLGVERRSSGPATRAIHRNIRLFPAPEWAMPFLALSMREDMPALTVAAAPSNVAQTKVASGIISDWMQKYSKERISSPRTAIVVPDENLLMPLLHSLPPDLQDVNLTMGHSLRFTATASFVGHLRRLQSRRRRSGGLTGYLRDDVRIFLAHPLVHVLVGTDMANQINGDIARFHLRVVSIEWIARYSVTLARILQPIEAGADAESVIGYIDSVLEEVDDALKGDIGEFSSVNSKMERSQIATYRLAMSRLLASVRRHDIEMTWFTVFHLVDRLLAAEPVQFEGKPLKGLQVMGLLETRAIDFDRLIILSMNDKVMPRRGRRRTFVPDTLRRGYGLPLSSQGEELYSYYFYRLISRAREVALIYDARDGEGMRSGGKSRFIMQLEMLYARDAVHTDSYVFGLETSEAVPQPVRKTPAVMKRLADFTAEKDGRNLSASALMNYCTCPVKFYYKNVVGLSDDRPDSEGISPILQGNIVHQALLNLYFPPKMRERLIPRDRRITLSASDLQGLLADDARIRREVYQAVHTQRGDEDSQLDAPLYGADLIVADRLVEQVKAVIEYDSTIAPITLVGGEMRGNDRFSVGQSPEVNVAFAFDRVDITAEGIRIVDYKTGKSNVEAAEADSIFNGDYKAKYLLQLLLYARLLVKKLFKEEGVTYPKVGLHIYDVNTIRDEGSVRPVVEKQTITDHSQLDEVFLPGIEKILTDIFDPEKPFEPTQDETACTFCAFRDLCTSPGGCTK